MGDAQRDFGGSKQPRAQPFRAHGLAVRDRGAVRAHAAISQHDAARSAGRIGA